VSGEGLPRSVVAIADAHEPFAAIRAALRLRARRDELGRPSPRRADIDAVSVVVANKLHREIVEALLDAGKHVLCEKKPLAPTAADGQAWPSAPRNRYRVASIGFTFRRSPAINAIASRITGGGLGLP